MIASFRAPTAHHSRTSFIAAHARPTTLANRPPSDELKFRGFGWSPSEGAWQRHLNDAGKWAEMRGRISQQTAKNQSSGQRQQISYMQRPTRKFACRCNDQRQDREIADRSQVLRASGPLMYDRETFPKDRPTKWEPYIRRPFATKSGSSSLTTPLATTNRKTAPLSLAKGIWRSTLSTTF